MTDVIKTSTETTPSALARRLLGELTAMMHSPEAPNALDRACTDAWLLGKGYLRFTGDGRIEYVPFAEIHKEAP